MSHNTVSDTQHLLIKTAGQHGASVEFVLSEEQGKLKVKAIIFLQHIEAIQSTPHNAKLRIAQHVSAR